MPSTLMFSRSKYTMVSQSGHRSLRVRILMHTQLSTTVSSCSPGDIWTSIHVRKVLSLHRSVHGRSRSQVPRTPVSRTRSGLALLLSNRPPFLFLDHKDFFRHPPDSSSEYVASTARSTVTVAPMTQSLNPSPTSIQHLSSVREARGDKNHDFEYGRPNGPNRGLTISCSRQSVFECPSAAAKACTHPRLRSLSASQDQV